MEFSDLHAFPYSRRPGTSASYLEGHVANQVKRERMRQIMQISRASFQDFRVSLLGSTRPVLWEGREGKGGRPRGLTDNYVRVEMETSEVEERSPDLTNKITPTLLAELKGDVVTARPVL